MPNIRRDVNIGHIVESYEAGESAAAIAARVGVSGQTVLRRLREAGVPVRTAGEASRLAFRTDPSRIEQARAAQKLGVQARRLDLDTQALAAAYQGGRSVHALAADLGISQDAVRTRLTEAGVEIRTLKQARAISAAAETQEAKAARAAKTRKALTGRAMSEEAVIKRARGKQGTKPHIGEFEETLREMLRSRGLDVRAQTAVERYNLDLTVGNLAIEVHHSAHHPSSRAHLRRRTEHLINAGWNVLYIWLRPAQKPTRTGRTWTLHPRGISERAADEVVAHLEALRRDPAAAGQYRVITGHGQETTAPKSDAHQRAGVGAPGDVSEPAP